MSLCLHALIVMSSVVTVKILLITRRQKKEQVRGLLTNGDELTLDCYQESLPAVTEWIESAKTNTA